MLTGESPAAAPRTARLWKATGVLVTLAAFLFLGRAVAGSWSALRAVEWSPTTFLWLWVACGLYGVSLGTGACVWLLMLRGTGEKASLRPALALFFLTQPAKYLPGNVGHHLGRVVLARRAGFALPRILLAMAFETGMVVVVGLLIGLGAALATGGEGKGGVALLLLAVVILCGLLPLAAAWLLKHRPRMLRRLVGEMEVKVPGWATMATGLLLDGLSFLCLGAGLDILARHLFGAPEGHLLQAVAVFSAAWVAGFLIPGAPAGFGVREAAVVAGLTQTYGLPAAVGAGLAMRAVGVGVDGLCGVAGWLGISGGHKREKETASQES